MVCLLGVYTFEITDVERVEKSMKFGYARSSRLGNHAHTQAVGRYEEQFEFTAVFFYKGLLHTLFFEEMAKLKIPLWFVMPSGEALEVVIEEMNVSRTYFDAGGQPVKQEIDFKLEGYHGNLSLF